VRITLFAKHDLTPDQRVKSCYKCYVIYFIIYELIYLSYVWQGVMVLLRVNLINGHWIAMVLTTLMHHVILCMIFTAALLALKSG